MKKTLFCFALILSSTVQAGALDEKAIYHALNIKPVEQIEASTNYKFFEKKLAGFISCIKWDFAWDAYSCAFGTNDGYSMEDSAYDKLNVPETLTRTTSLGKWYEKKAGGLTCTKVVYHRPFLYQGDILLYSSSTCKVALTFGRIIL